MSYGGLYVYVSNAISRNIFVLQLDPVNGYLEMVQQIGVGSRVMPLAVSPDRRFLYAALRTEPFGIAAFAIDAFNGKLTHLGNAPAPESIPYLCTDQSGRFLLAAVNPEDVEGEPRSGQITVSAIGPHGLVQPPHQLVRTEPQAHCIVPDPSNRFVFVSSLAGDMVLRHRFDAATGRFLPDPLPPVRTKPKAGPRHLVFHPNNRFLYLINELDGTVYAFAYDVRAGALDEIQTLNALPPDFGDKRPLASDIHVTPDGRYLYASERTSSTIAAFKIDAGTGLLTPAGSYPTEKVPRGFNIDPYGRYMLVVGRKSNSMTCYAIDRESGGLSAIKTYAMGDDPNWIEIVRLS